MKKVTIEITEKGWQTTIWLNDKRIIDTHELQKFNGGCRIMGMNESIEFNDDVPDDLGEAIHSLSGNLGDTAFELKRIKP